MELKIFYTEKENILKYKDYLQKGRKYLQIMFMIRG